MLSLLVSRCSADKGAPKLNPRPLACFNRVPWQEEGRWGKAHRLPRRGCPAGTERPDLELLRECSGALRQSCQKQAPVIQKVDPVLTRTALERSVLIIPNTGF